MSSIFSLMDVSDSCKATMVTRIDDVLCAYTLEGIARHRRAEDFARAVSGHTSNNI